MLNSDREFVRGMCCPLPNTGIVIYPPRGQYGPRWQSDYQLVLVLTGSAIVEVDAVAREIPAGYVALLLPDRTEFFTFAAERETCHSWIALPPWRLAASERTALDHAPPLLALSTAMHDCVTLARTVVGVDDPAERPVLAALAHAAFMLYVAEAAQMSMQHRLEHPVIQRARAVILQRAAEGIGVDALARDVGMSAEHLTRLFRRDIDTTPGELLRQERLRHGARLLEHTGLPVAEVARQSGFVSSQHFARSFRHSTGLAPTAFRVRTRAARERP